MYDRERRRWGKQLAIGDEPKRGLLQKPLKGLQPESSQSSAPGIQPELLSCFRPFDPAQMVWVPEVCLESSNWQLAISN